jgi:hypothetical protein
MSPAATGSDPKEMVAELIAPELVTGDPSSAPAWESSSAIMMENDAGPVNVALMKPPV